MAALSSSNCCSERLLASISCAYPHEPRRAKESLITSAVAFLILGGVATLVASRADFLFGGNAMRLDPGIANLVQNSPYVLWGIGGAFLVAGLVKEDEKKN